MCEVCLGNREIRQETVQANPAMLNLKGGENMKILNVNQRIYPKSKNPFDTNDTESYIEITAVLVEGEIGDYAVYIGIGSPDFVSARGNKLNFNEALCHFPNLEKEKYRE